MILKTVEEKSSKLNPLIAPFIKDTPELKIELGIEDGIVVTLAITLHSRLMYLYTHKDFRRNGYGEEHLIKLVNRGIVDTIIIPNDSKAMMMLAVKHNFAPKGTYNYLHEDKYKKSYKHYIYAINEVATPSKNPYESLAAALTENSITVDGSL